MCVTSVSASVCLDVCTRGAGIYIFIIGENLHICIHYSVIILWLRSDDSGLQCVGVSTLFLVDLVQRQGHSTIHIYIKQFT